MRHYATLFDSKYLPQGLVLYESLKKHSSEPFELYILAMDLGLDLALTLSDLKIPNFITLGAMEQYECRLEDLRLSRSWQEHCWTMASVWSHWLLMYQGLNEITYLDADMMFFSDPKVIHDEIGDRSIAVIPHRLIPSKKHLEVNGKFNVSWVTFKNNPAGRECLSTWAAQCREKCSAIHGCGDQKYLDEWPEKYGNELCVIQNIGAGLAPWNLANYELIPHDGRLVVAPILQRAIYGNAIEYSAVFYHYHEFKEISVSDREYAAYQNVPIQAAYRLTNYDLRQEDVKFIYEPYLEAYKAVKARITAVHA